MSLAVMTRRSWTDWKVVARGFISPRNVKGTFIWSTVEGGTNDSYVVRKC